MSIQAISPQQLQDLLQQQPDTVLLDVREDEEVALCALPHHTHIAMNRIPLCHNKLPDDVPIVVYCHHGIRSLNVARYLENAGFEQLYNLSGGIDAWAQAIDPTMPRY